MARVLLWSNAYWPLIGGVEILGEKLVGALSKRGHAFVVITDQAPGTAEYSEHNGAVIHRLPMLDAVRNGNIESWVRVKKRVAAIKREFKPDIVWEYFVHADSMFHLMTESEWRAPTLVTLHAIFADGLLSESSAQRKVVESAAWVAACSEFAIADARRLVPAIAERSSVIANGLEMPNIAIKPLQFDAPTFLCLGRIGSKEEKGFDVAIDAMIRVLQQHPAARLRIAGDGAGRAGLETHAIERGVAHAVDFLGWVHPDNVPSAMNDATVVLMPSRVPEGFGLVALQAQQMARPVIASRVGGVPEVVQDGVTGLLVRVGDGDALADAMLELLRDPQRAATMGQAGNKRARQEFSFELHADRYNSLITTLANKQSALEHA